MSNIEINTIDSEIREGSDGSMESLGLTAALMEMMPHWKSHLADGQSPSILATDLKRLESKVRELRHVIEEFQGERPKSQIEVSLDGGETYDPAPQGVRITYKDVIVDSEDEDGELDFNFTHEGMVTDLWVSREDPMDHNLATDSEMIEDIQHRLVKILDSQ